MVTTGPSINDFGNPMPWLMKAIVNEMMPTLRAGQVSFIAGAFIR